MGFPKKGTHLINVDGIEYLWHLNIQWETSQSTRWITIRKKDSVGQLLRVDPWHPHLISAAGVAQQAINFALRYGWTPDRRAPPMKVGWVHKVASADMLVVLPANATPAPQDQAVADRST